MIYEMSGVTRKPAFCIGENKAADKLCIRASAQCLCLHYIDIYIYI